MTMQASDFDGVYAITPTPAKDGADHWSATDTVDVEETQRLVNKLIDDGVAGILALGTTGECATLTPDEFRTFSETVVATAAGRVPTFIGCTALGTHEVVARARYLQDLGATGTLLGLPMWQQCTEEMAVRYYADIAEAAPELSIMVYANTRMFRFDFGPSFWGQVVKVAPTVTSAKFGGFQTYQECLDASEGKINFLSIEMSALKFAQIAPDAYTACWSTASSMGPQPARALMAALKARDYEKAAEIDADIQWACETFIPADPTAFNSLNIQLEKLRMAGAGYCKPGPIRPPYNFVSAEYEANARECGRRWVEIAKKYA